MAQPVPVAAASVPVVNGATTIDNATLGTIIRDIISVAEGQAMEVKDLPMKLTDKLSAGGLQIPARQRIDIIKQVKDPAFLGQLAAASGFILDGDLLSV